MKHFVFTLPLFGLVALIFLKVISSFVAKRRRNAEAARRGCLPAPAVPNNDLLNISRLRESIRATKEDRGPQYIAETMDEIGKHVHTVRLQAFDYELVVTRDPENIKAMLATQSQDFDIGTHRQKAFGAVMGPGIFTNRGQDWKHSRALIRPQFGRDQVADLSLFERHFQSLHKVLQTRSDGWTETVDLSPLFFNTTLDVTTEFIWGQSVHSQDPSARSYSWDKDSPDFGNFGHHLDEAKKWIDRRGALAKYGWLLNSRDFDRHCVEIKKFVDYFVKARLARRTDEKQIEDPARKQKFILLDELAKDTQDPIQLRNETLHIMMAGRDPSGALSGWVFYFLARYPAVLEKLRTEITTAFGSSTQPDKIAVAQIQSCKYLQYVLNEVLRVVAVIPMNERVALRDTTLPTGGGPDGTAPIFVPKGNQVLIPQYAMQHRADIWGADVEDFKPERWDNRKFGWEFVPFGGGARQCIGRECLPSHSHLILSGPMLTLPQNNSAAPRSRT